jgi:hypothetical protein
MHCSNFVLFDHLVGEQLHQAPHHYVERLRGFHAEDHLDLGRSASPDIAGLLALASRDNPMPSLHRLLLSFLVASGDAFSAVGRIIRLAGLIAPEPGADLRVAPGCPGMDGGHR